MDAHISTLTCHTTILEQLLETAATEQQEPAVTELKRAVDRARGILDDAHMAKNLMTEDEKIQGSEEDAAGQLRKSAKSESDQRPKHKAETTQRSVIDDEDEKFFDASERRGCDRPKSQQKQESTNDTNTEATTATPTPKRRLSTS